MFKRGKTDKVWPDTRYVRHFFGGGSMVGEAEKNPTESVTFHILRRS